MKHFDVLLLILLSLTMMPTFAHAQQPTAACEMAFSFDQTDVDVRARKTPVWSTAGDTSARAALLFGEKLHVNTDGTPRSYSVDDPRGERFALNRICNAMRGYCKDLKRKEKEQEQAAYDQRYADLRAARDQHWPAPLLQATRLSSRVIVMTKGRPCPEHEEGGNKYLVSATALQRVRPSQQCSFSSYVDALTVPALVLPGDPEGRQSDFRRNQAGPGDVFVAWRQGLPQPVFGVVGDTGAWNKLGEGSIALNGALLQLTGTPANYVSVLRDYVVPRAYVLVFPRTRTSPPLMTNDTIEPVARSAFASFGGGSEERAFDRLRACAAQYEAALQP